MDLKDEKSALLFGVRRSIRYHNRRRMFFDRWNLTTSALSVIFGSATIYGVLRTGGETLALAAATLVTILSSINLVIGTVRMARLHEDLARRFIDLEKAIILAGDFNAEQYATFVANRLDIEACEPPILRVLDSMCHNEMMRSMGFPPDHPEYVKITGLQRICAQFLDIAEHRIVSSRQSA